MLRGSGALNCLETEKTARLNARRSIVSAVDIPAGTTIEEDMLTYKRPGVGITPDKLPKILGLTAKTDIPEDTILMMEMFDERG